MKHLNTFTITILVVLAEILFSIVYVSIVSNEGTIDSLMYMIMIAPMIFVLLAYISVTNIRGFVVFYLYLCLILHLLFVMGLNSGGAAMGWALGLAYFAIINFILLIIFFIIGRITKK